ncbi:MAG TPA: SCO family protein [Planctomycetota bacterium]|nr:SCO family protein [Planctomycetota bacterium]
MAPHPKTPRSARAPTRGGRLALSAGLVAALAIVLAAAFAGRDGRETGPRDAPAALPVLWSVPAFTLTDSTGRAFSSAELDGKVWVACFIFTRCSDTCPQMTRRLRAVEDAIKAVPGLADSVRLVSFSVDPARDKPRDLEEYAAANGADRDLRVFLTGEKGAVAALSRDGFKLAVGEDPAGSEDVVHSDRFALVDREGRLRSYYSPLTETKDLQRLVEDLKRLAREGSREGSAEQ